MSRCVGQPPVVLVVHNGAMRRLAPAALIVVLLATLAACSKQPGPDKALGAFLDGWRSGNFPASVLLVDPSGASLTGAAVAEQIKSMSGDLAEAKPTITPGKAKVVKKDATVPLTIAWPVGTGVTWTYQITLPMSYKDSKWRVTWSPAVFEPDMTATDKFSVTRSTGPRGKILDGAGNPITDNLAVVDIGIQPSLVKDLNRLLSDLDAAFKSVGQSIDLSQVAGQVHAASPNAFVYVVTLRDTVYQRIKSRIHDLDGTVFRSYTKSLAPSSTFARALIGTVSDVTKEQLDKNPGKYHVGDQVGNGGLQARYDDQLQGKAGVSVKIVPAKAGSGDTNNSDDSSDKSDKVAFHSDAGPGGTVKTTIDPKVQNAAEQALAGQTKNTAIVAIRISDGAVLAVANGPAGAAYDFALQAQVPPGSMFKAVTATNLLDAGKLTTSTPVNCPATLTVSGYTIKNSGGEVLGNVPLIDDFAQSCNTAFASLAPQLGPTGLRDTAKVLGIGEPWDIGIDAYTGSVSANGDATEQAAAAFGQGKTLVSPLIMASAAASIQRGQFKQPKLVLDPAPAKPAADGPALKSSTVDAMKQMMRKVVTDGTGVKCKNVPGAPVYGKTGTAEYDNNPDHAHSWFMGYRGDIAFATFVESGGLSTQAAVPITAQFFTLLG
jgi:cell division protein FtsI/penicillin-binding protein 2